MQQIKPGATDVQRILRRWHCTQAEPGGRERGVAGWSLSVAAVGVEGDVAPFRPMILGLKWKQSLYEMGHRM
jgi:hypothetical protein